MISKTDRKGRKEGREINGFPNKPKKGLASGDGWFLVLPPRILPSKRTVSPKSVVSWTCLEFIVMVKPSTGLRGGATRSPFTWRSYNMIAACHFYNKKQTQIK